MTRIRYFRDGPSMICYLRDRVDGNDKNGGHYDDGAWWIGSSWVPPDRWNIAHWVEMSPLEVALLGKPLVEGSDK